MGWLTQRMAAAQLRLLCVLALELVADAIQELDVTLLRVLLQGSDKRPGHSPGSFPSNSCVLSIESPPSLERHKRGHCSSAVS